MNPSISGPFAWRTDPREGKSLFSASRTTKTAVSGLTGLTPFDFINANCDLIVEGRIKTRVNTGKQVYTNETEVYEMGPAKLMHARFSATKKP